MHLFAFFEAFVLKICFFCVFYRRKKAMSIKHVRLSKWENFLSELYL